MMLAFVAPQRHSNPSSLAEDAVYYLQRVTLKYSSEIDSSASAHMKSKII